MEDREQGDRAMTLEERETERHEDRGHGDREPWL